MSGRVQSVSGGAAAPAYAVQPPVPATSQFGLWSIAFVLSLAYALSNLDRFLVGVALEPIKASLGLTDTQLGIMIGPALAIPNAIFSPIAGRMADRVDRCRLIAFGMLAWSLSTAAIAFAMSFGTMIGARAIVGLGEAVLLPAGTSLLVSYFAREQLGRATGVFISGAAIGKATAFIGGGALLVYLTANGGLHLGVRFSPWQSLFIISAALGIPMVIFFLLLPDPDMAVARAKRAGAPPMADLLRHLRGHKRAWISHLLYVTVVALCNSVFLSWSPSFYSRKFDLSAGNAAMLAGVATVAVAPIGYWVGGLVVDRLRQKGMLAGPPLLVGAALLALVPACALFALSGHLWISLCGYALVQLCAQMCGPASTVGLMRMTPSSYRGVVMGSFLVIAMLGSVGTGPALVGVINDHAFGGQSLGSAMLIIVGLAALIGSAVAFSNKRPFERAVVED